MALFFLIGGARYLLRPHIKSMVRTENETERSLMDIDSLVAAQVQEMEVVRQKVYSLEQTQIAIKQR